MSEQSPKEVEVYEFIITYKTQHAGTSPTYDEIMEACNISSKSTVGYYLDNLERRKLLKQLGVRNIVIPNSKWEIEE